MSPSHPGSRREGRGSAATAQKAFTLLEVMIALGIFFMAVFTILALVSNTLRNARSLRRPQVDAGMAAAIYTATNRFYEGSSSGDFEDVLKEKHLENLWETMEQQFKSALKIQPFIIANGREDGWITPTHLTTMGFYILRVRSNLVEISNVLTR